MYFYIFKNLFQKLFLQSLFKSPFPFICETKIKKYVQEMHLPKMYMSKKLFNTCVEQSM